MDNSGKAVNRGRRDRYPRFDRCYAGDPRRLNGLRRPLRALESYGSAFAKEIVRSINDESENGSTRFHLMFDEAMEHAIDQGAEGIEEHPEQEF
jgi:hypothetical protein